MQHDVVESRSWVGQPIERREDVELLTGAGRFIGDLTRPGMLHAAFLRSPLPHAEIRSIDVTAAEAASGVHAVFTGADLAPSVPQQPTPHRVWGQKDTPYYALARGRVRYAGEAVALVVAESRYLAEDARELIEVDWEPLPSVGSMEASLAEDAPVLYPGWTDNVAGTFDQEMGDVDRAFAEADVVVERVFSISRVFGCPLEGRGVLAEWEPSRQELTVWSSTQTLHVAQDCLAETLGIPAHKVRVRVPRLGGGFGSKFHFYPEEVAVSFASRALGRPVRWVEDRTEAFLSTVHACQEVIKAEMAATVDGVITGVKASIKGDMGGALHTMAYGPVWLTAVMMTNVYQIPNARVHLDAVLTNKTPFGSYRGWGQPQANFAVERLVDAVAAEVGIDRFEIRRRNFIPPDKFPYTSLHHVFDSGDYAAALDRALNLSGYEEWRTRQEQMRGEGRHVGIGVSFYVENTALGPSRILNEGGVDQGGYDIAHVRIEPSGEAIVYTGLCDMGQGLTNALAQVCAEELGLHPDQVTVVTGDTEMCPRTGYGTGASRSTAVGGAAVMKACAVLREKIKAIAAHMLEASSDDLVLTGGAVQVRGDPSSHVTMADVGRAAYLRIKDLPEGMDPGLAAIEVFDPPQMAWPYGVNVAVVEVDAGTGGVSFLDYAYVHDCGTVVNPMLVDGQIHGAVAQGISMALHEELVYDDRGQPLFSTFMDYVLPTSAEVPRLRLDHLATPSPIIPGGMKGVGEAGVIGSPAAVAAAIEDALSVFSVQVDEVPLTPDRIVALIEAARQPA